MRLKLKMELKIISTKENPLFDRKEIVCEIESKTPVKNEEILSSLAGEVKKPTDNVVIKSVKGKFGTNKFVVIGKVYDTKELREEMEGKLPEAPKVEETNVGTESAEAPAEVKEEVKEEAPVEKKEGVVEENSEAVSGNSEKRVVNKDAGDKNE